MVKHIIIWSFKEELTQSEKLEAAKKIKAGLEGLGGKIEGLSEIRVYTEGLPSSNGDLMLDSTFESVSALEGYQTNPLHVEVATYVRSQVSTRMCFDFEV